MVNEWLQYFEIDKNISHVNIILYFSILKDYILFKYILVMRK